MGTFGAHVLLLWVLLWGKWSLKKVIFKAKTQSGELWMERFLMVPKNLIVSA